MGGRVRGGVEVNGGVLGVISNRWRGGVGPHCQRCGVVGEGGVGAHRCVVLWGEEEGVLGMGEGEVGLVEGEVGLVEG